MANKVLEETVLELEQLKVGIGVLKRFYECTEGLLTTYRLSFRYYNNETKTIFISSVTSVKISNRFFQDYLVLQSGAVRYFVSCSDNEKLYSELLRVVKLSESTSVVGKPRAAVGIARVVGARRERAREARSMQASLTDLGALRKKSQLVKQVVVRLGRNDREGFNRSIDQVFRNLGVDLAELPEEALDADTYEQVRKLAGALVRKNEAVPLHEFYCALNRLLLTNLLSPSQLLKYVARLERERLCRLHKVGGVYLLARGAEYSLDHFCDDLLAAVQAGPTDHSRFARERKISATLAQLKLSVAEQSGLVVRDDSVDQIYYYFNHFNQYQVM